MIQENFKSCWFQVCLLNNFRLLYLLLKQITSYKKQHFIYKKYCLILLRYRIVNVFLIHSLFVVKLYWDVNLFI